MIKQSYVNGFMRKCAERGVDYRSLLGAIDPHIMKGTITQARPYMPATVPSRTNLGNQTRRPTEHTVGNNVGAGIKNIMSPRMPKGNVIDITPSQLDRVFSRLLQGRGTLRNTPTRKQPVFITR